MKLGDALTLAALAALGYVGWRAYRGAGAIDIGEAASWIAGKADDAISGAVVAVGKVVGVPETDAERGERAWASGDYFDASLYLPAGDFAGHVWEGFKADAQPTARLVDYTKARDTTPLTAYFRQYGNSAGTRAEAARQGWTADEISMAVAVMAEQYRQETGYY